MGIDWRYVRMSVNARRALAERIRQRERVWYEGSYVKYTQTTVGLLNAILERINRETGKAEIAYSVLHEVTGIVSRQTLARHVYLLEKAGCIAVTRGVKVARDRNATNVYRLVGDTALAFLGAGWSPKVKNRIKNRTDNVYDGRTDNNKKHNDDDGCKDNPLLEKVVEKLKTILDADVAERVAGQHDGAYLIRLAEWVEAQRWVNNKGGIFMVKLRAKFVPPEGSAVVVDEPKPMVEYQRQSLRVVEHREPVIGEWDNPKWALLDTEFRTWANLPIRRDEASLQFENVDGRVIIRYDIMAIRRNVRGVPRINGRLVENYVSRIARREGLVVEFAKELAVT